MVKETVNVIIRQRGILTFDVTIHQRSDESTARASATLTKINGEEKIDGELVSEMTEGTVEDALLETFAYDDLKNAAYVAEQVALSRCGRL